MNVVYNVYEYCKLGANSSYLRCKDVLCQGKQLAKSAPPLLDPFAHQTE